MDDIVSGSLFENLNVDREVENEVPSERDMEREQFLQIVRENGPREGVPHPNYIYMDHKTGLLHADPDAEIVSLEHCMFVPLPYHALPRDQEEHMKIAVEEFEKIAQNPLIVSLVIPTPPLLIRLSCKPGMRYLKQIDAAKAMLFQKYRNWKESGSKCELEKRQMLQNYMHLEFQVSDFPTVRNRFEDVGWARYITSCEVLTQYMRAKKLIEMTVGFSNFDVEAREVLKVYISKANARLTDGLTIMGREISRDLSDDVNELVSQILCQGEIRDLRYVRPANLEAACIKYTIDAIRLIEKWILSVAGIAAEDLMDYHQTSPYLENQFRVDWTLQERCTRENLSIFTRRAAEENERWRSFAPDRPDVSSTLIQWPSAPSEQNIQFPPSMFSKEMVASLVCALAYERLEDRHTFARAARTREIGNFYSGVCSFDTSEYNQPPVLWIDGNQVALWTFKLKTIECRNDNESDESEED